jgi:hypothetical protein
VGAVFAIIALTSTVTYVSYSMGILDNYNQSVLTKNQQLSDANKEKFQISSVTVPNSKLNITVTNTGSVPINLTKIWIQNMSTSDWVKSYTPTNSFAAPGGILTKIGQNIPAYINSAKSYNVKLVTSRGNTQQFTVNSIVSTKLNIQLFAFPTTVSSGFSSSVVLVVTNNSTGPIVNLTPTASVSPTPPGPPNCQLGSVNPSKDDTLLPGGTVVFTWPVSVTGSNNDVCTVTVQLQNGQTLQTNVTVQQVTLSSTTYAQNAGVVTLDYTSFKWAQGDGFWHNDWSFNHGNTVFSVTISNNNQTAGGYKLWLSENSQLFFQVAGGNGAPKSFYIIKNVNLNNLQLTAYNPNYFNNISNQGGISTISFGSSGIGSSSNGANAQSLPAGTYIGFMVLYGKFAVNQNDVGSQYAQTIPFMAVIAS